MANTSRPRVEIVVHGRHHPIRCALSDRDGEPGLILSQGGSWVWADLNAWDNLIDIIDDLLDKRDEPRLGRLESFPRPPAVRPSQWQRASG